MMLFSIRAQYAIANRVSVYENTAAERCYFSVKIFSFLDIARISFYNLYEGLIHKTPLAAPFRGTVSY